MFWMCQDISSVHKGDVMVGVAYGEEACYS